MSSRSSIARRWVLRIAAAGPFLLVALLAAPALLATSANASLVERAQAIDWTRIDGLWLTDIHPPLATVIAVIVPGGALGLSIAGALLAGVMVHRFCEVMARQGLSRTSIWVTVTALVANPLFLSIVVNDFSTIAGLAFFGIALTSLVRFVSSGDTQSGFTAGCLLMVATLIDANGVFYAVAAVLATPFLKSSRTPQAGRRRAQMLVVIYPTLSALVTLELLDIFFLRAPVLTQLGTQLAGAGDRLATVLAMAGTPIGLLVMAPIAMLWISAILLRRASWIVLSGLVFGSLTAGFVLGFLPLESNMAHFTLLTILGIILIPSSRRTISPVVISSLALAQIVIVWVAASMYPSGVALVAVLTSGVTALF